MKQLIAVLLLLTIILPNTSFVPNSTITSREDQTGDCLLKGNCRH